MDLNQLKLLNQQVEKKMNKMYNSFKLENRDAYTIYMLVLGVAINNIIKSGAPTHIIREILNGHIDEWNKPGGRLQ
tara:strand:- start:215 stop:442 length:228 start_codon:yes stop_codon:yes gene_type:complete